MDGKTIALCEVVRQCLIQLLNALEDFMGRERTIPSRDMRRAIKFYQQEFRQR